MNQRNSGQPDHTLGYRRGRLSVMLLLSVGLGLGAGCTTSGTDKDDDGSVPATTPEQGAANPTAPLTPTESSQPDSTEGDTIDSPDTAPDSGSEEPATNPDAEPASGPDTAPEPTTVTRAECDAAPSAIQTRMLDLINETRASARNCGSQAFAATTPLTWNDKLETAAASHSLDMSSVNFFSHTGSNGSDIRARAEAVNYNFRNLGENLAAGQRTAAAAMEGLINSPGHCANLMNPSYREVGVACSTDTNSDYNYYWTQVFGTQQ